LISVSGICKAAYSTTLYLVDLRQATSKLGWSLISIIPTQHIFVKVFCQWKAPHCFHLYLWIPLQPNLSYAFGYLERVRSLQILKQTSDSFVFLVNLDDCLVNFQKHCAEDSRRDRVGLLFAAFYWTTDSMHKAS
jgi:hypothetical protein